MRGERETSWQRDEIEAEEFAAQLGVVGHAIETDACAALAHRMVTANDATPSASYFPGFRMMTRSEVAISSSRECRPKPRFLGLRPEGQRTNETSTRALFAFWLVGYVLWLTQSSVYRFAVTLEMLAPLLVVALLAR